MHVCHNLVFFWSDDYFYLWVGATQTMMWLSRLWRWLLPQLIWYFFGVYWNLAGKGQLPISNFFYSDQVYWSVLARPMHSTSQFDKKSLSKCVFVCVWTIWIDVKLLPCFCRGAVNLIPSTAQRRRWFEIVISGLIIPTYLQFSQFIVNGYRLSQVPACRSKPFQLLHCCRNLVLFYFILSSIASEPSSEQGRRKHTSNWIARWINQFLLSDFTGLFVHVRCIPHQ